MNLKYEKLNDFFSINNISIAHYAFYKRDLKFVIGRNKIGIDFFIPYIQFFNPDDGNIITFDINFENCIKIVRIHSAGIRIDVLL